MLLGANARTFMDVLNMVCVVVWPILYFAGLCIHYVRYHPHSYQICCCLCVQTDF